MKSYGQFCPVAKAAELFCERWNALIIRDLAVGPRRFSDLQRGVPLMSPSLLSSRLRWLTAENILRRRKAEGVGHVYELTAAGREFVPLVEGLGIWGQRWTRRELQDHEIDLGLLVWSLESSADPKAFGDRSCLVRLELTDQGETKRYWWFLNSNGKCQLCLEHPGGEVDLYLACTLPDAIYIVRGDLALAQAVDEARFEVLGEKWARDGMEAWLNLSALSKIPSVRQDGTMM